MNSKQPETVAVGSGRLVLPPYDPLESLSTEVERFKATNAFTPMLVTNFYAQAACVVSELRDVRKELESLRKTRERQAAVIRHQEKAINEYEEQAVDEGRF